MTRIPTRPTSTSDVPKTAAATAARRRAYTARIALELAGRLDELDDDRVARLAAVLVAEAHARGLAVWDLRMTHAEAESS